MAEDDDLITPLFTADVEKAMAEIHDQEYSKKLDEYEAKLDELKPQYRQFAVAPRRSGKVIKRVLHGSIFNPSTREYRLADGTKVTEEELARLSPTTLNGLANKVQAVLANTRSIDRPRLPADPANLPPYVGIRWLESKRFTYMALWVQDTQRWYITGTGAQYGGNELNHPEMLHVLERLTVEHLEEVTGWRKLDLPPL